MSETPGNYNVGGQVPQEPDLSPRLELDLLWNEVEAIRPKTAKDFAVSGAYFARVADMARAAVIGGATDVDDIADFAVKLTDKLIKNVETRK